MSYILDALKRADSDREREAASVPDLHAQADAARGAEAARRTSGWLLLAIAAGAITLAALAWRWFGAAPEDELPQAPVTQAPSPAQSPPPAPAPAPAPSPALAPAPIPPAPAAPQGQAAAPPPATVPPRVSVLVPPPKPERQSAEAPATAVPAPAAPVAAETRLLTPAELPADIRSKLPALTVGGSMYSPTAKNRMVILNGQVFREGDKPADGLSVEEIRLKSTVLAFRGLRFELKH